MVDGDIECGRFTVEAGQKSCNCDLLDVILHFSFYGLVRRATVIIIVGLLRLMSTKEETTYGLFNYDAVQ